MKVLQLNRLSQFSILSHFIIHRSVRIYLLKTINKSLKNYIFLRIHSSELFEFEKLDRNGGRKRDILGPKVRISVTSLFYYISYDNVCGDYFYLQIVFFKGITTNPMSYTATQKYWSRSKHLWIGLSIKNFWIGKIRTFDLWLWIYLQYFQWVD